MSISAVLKTTCGAQMIRIFLSISIQLENTFKFIVNIRSKMKEKEEGMLNLSIHGEIRSILVLPPVEVMPVCHTNDKIVLGKTKY